MALATPIEKAGGNSRRLRRAGGQALRQSLRSDTGFDLLNHFVEVE